MLNHVIDKDICLIYAANMLGCVFLMAIDRKSLVNRHNPVLHSLNIHSPLSVGNGELAFTADVTGMQTLYSQYAQTFPLCTMSQWGWHSFPSAPDPAELELAEYDYNGRIVRYATRRQPHNEAVYDYLRQNPHRLNLARIGLRMDRKEPERIDDISQTLFLWHGYLDSLFTIDSLPCHIQTSCAPEEDTLAFQIEGEALRSGRLSVAISFPYGSPSKSASDWSNEEAHESVLDNLCITRRLDDTTYCSALSIEGGTLTQDGDHTYVIIADQQAKQLKISIRFSLKREDPLPCDLVFAASRKYWESFWQTGGAVELWDSRDPRAKELERRIVLSQYVTAIQCSGTMPPQETGLSCNSWYGKFHLEMHPSHALWFPLWNHADLLERSLPWYREHILQAEKNAAINGFRGVRWPKMIGPEGMESPSPIGTLLVWQQPHIIEILELLYQSRPSKDFLIGNWFLVERTAEFMVDFAVYNDSRNCYELTSPIMPAQEVFDPLTALNPTFELEYWHTALNIAADWAERLDKPHQVSFSWRQVANKMSPSAYKDDVYLAHQSCNDTFSRFNRDHPSMLFAYGSLPGNRLEPARVQATLETVLKTWNFDTLWGWDFGQMAMTATRLGLPKVAIDILLEETGNNHYEINGNNAPLLRRDLPLYLPGNGTLLTAIAMMCAGYRGCARETPGFPQDGTWNVRWEGLMPLPQ